MKKNVFITTLILIITVFIITIGSTYAYFTSTVTGSEGSTTLSVGGGTLSIAMNGGSAITVSNIAPSSTAIATKTITITSTNTTNLILPYTLKLVIDNNSFSANAIPIH